LAVLQVSSVHVYLTYPFVLSWSLLEAMSMQCAIVASNTAPVKEVISNKETGLLVDFFNQEELARSVIGLLSGDFDAYGLGSRAREKAVLDYDLKTVSLPRQIAWIESGEVSSFN